MTAPTATKEDLAAPPTPGPAAPVDWVPADGGRNLALDGSWACTAGVQVIDGRPVLQAGEDYVTVANREGPYLKLQGDVSIAVTLEVNPGGWGALVLWGALPTGAWWQGINRLDIELGREAIGVTFYDGTGQNPAFTHSFPAAGRADRVRLHVRRQGTQFFFLVDEQPVGQIDDPGLFPDGVMYLGANAAPGSQVTIHEIVAQAPEGETAMVEIVNPQQGITYDPAKVPLREWADRRDVEIGAAVSAHPLRCEAAYALAVTHEFSMLTTENAAKFGPIHPQPDQYAFEDADTIVNVATEHGMQVRGHTLVWHRQLPGWLEKGMWTRDELLEVLREHIHTVVGRYRGRIVAWDVVNEAIADDGDWRNTIWHRVIGPDYLDLAFRWAHEADPDALLFYNDYGGEGMNAKSDAIYDLVKGMLDRGVPIHGVGLQMHITAGGGPSAEDLRRNIDRLGALGLQVHITELDVRILGDPIPAKLQQQANTYRQVFDVCLDTPHCTTIVLWGFTDRHSWIPAFFEGYGSALIFDESYRPKPAYNSVYEILAQTDK